jgi:capsid portal protein
MVYLLSWWEVPGNGITGMREADAGKKLRVSVNYSAVKYMRMVCKSTT